MFLIAITKDEIAQRFHDVNVEQRQCASHRITTVFDGVFAKDSVTDSGFVVEERLGDRTNGHHIPFSYAIYDDKARIVDIGTETFGGRPLYYHQASNGDFFCSTHISLMRDAGVPIEENVAVLPEFFVYRYVMPPATLYKGIKRLGMGGKMRLRVHGDECRIYSITPFNPLVKNGYNIHSLSSATDAVQRTLRKSVRKLHSNRFECANLLSGGIDSSILASLSNKELSLRRSYSTGYPFEAFGMNREKRYALSAAAALEMDHTYYEAAPEEYYHGFIEAIAHAEEPLHHLQSTLLHLLMRNQIDERILLCGQGAGSSFGSNSYFYINQNRELPFYRFLFSKPIAHNLNMLSVLVGTGEELTELLAHPKARHPLSNPAHPMWSWMEYGCRQWACQFFNATEESIIRNRYEAVRRLQRSFYTRWSLYSLFSDEDMTLAIWSKIGEGNGKLLYYPYYDAALLKAVFATPWSIKLQKPKDALRRELAKVNNVPSFILDRKKSSFGLRSRGWARKGGVFEPLVPLAAKAVHEREIRKLHSLNPKKMMTFWNALNYGIWKRLCIENEPVEALREELT